MHPQRLPSIQNHTADVLPINPTRPAITRRYHQENGHHLARHATAGQAIQDTESNHAPVIQYLVAVRGWNTTALQTATLARRPSVWQSLSTTSCPQAAERSHAAVTRAVSWLCTPCFDISCQSPFHCDCFRCPFTRWPSAVVCHSSSDSRLTQYNTTKSSGLALADAQFAYLVLQCSMLKPFRTLRAKLLDISSATWHERQVILIHI